MKFISTALFTLFVVLQLNTANAQEDPYLGIVPAPVSLIKSPGQFIFSKTTVIKADRPKEQAVELFKDFLLNNRGLNNRIIKYSPKVKGGGTSVIFTSRGAAGLPNEGYKLTITPRKITVIGKGAGLFYGIQTLMQLFAVDHAASESLPCLVINDEPRFGYRGIMLDVSRHFFNVKQVKQVIDLMAAYKLNNFHWHLVDGQGWRVEIKKYPKLTQIGGTRQQTMFGTNRDWPDGLDYTGFYTQDEIKDVVKYAAQKYINIVPEIEMPAHSDAALRAYPELMCTPDTGIKNPARTTGLYCPTEETFTFLENVLTEVMELFPGKYIHIGGDEANKQPWKESAFCQNLIRQLGLKDENALQSYFIQRIEKFLNAKGRSIIGWDEILEGGLAPNATVMSWTGEQGGIAAARQKHNVIMTPQTTGLYFDHYQSKSSLEPVSFGRYAVFSETYNYEPVPNVLTADEKKYIIGVQGNLWTEYVPTVAKLQYQILPRLFALSEIAWSKPERKDYKNFSEARLAKHFARLDAMHYNYRVPTAFEVIDTMLIGPKFTMSPKSAVPGAKIVYTLNGRDPLDTDLGYESPITFNIPPGEKRTFKTVVITPSGRRSLPTNTIMYNQAPVAAVNYTANNPGLKFTLIRGVFTSTNQLDYAPTDSTGIAKSLETTEFRKTRPSAGVVFEGYISVITDGIYNFSLANYADCQLFIDDIKLGENEGAISLLKGFHKIKIRHFYNAPPAGPRRRASPSPRVYIVAAGTTDRRVITPEMFFN
ncbi:family 20 glycosylhydrolase [Mucilaginibacter xinganensis]|uniref:beta-N-acetylhexosaminidase n=1 Tax=Mucilaginibacter xinganensis TaxID=1234841 RepID=A0A223NSG5_9SPHI|nr:family 20 glycosylhydrolase [Mucilaginibacter xinganensis]ASU32451.1 beta-N-acetylhexosaminidase [Mucilaginibacter xinganensis]